MRPLGTDALSAGAWARNFEKIVSDLVCRVAPKRFAASEKARSDELPSLVVIAGGTSEHRLSCQPNSPLTSFDDAFTLRMTSSKLVASSRKR